MNSGCFLSRQYKLGILILLYEDLILFKCLKKIYAGNASYFSWLLGVWVPFSSGCCAILGFSFPMAKLERLTLHGFLVSFLKHWAHHSISYSCVSYSPDIQGVILEVKTWRSKDLSYLHPCTLTSYCSNGPTHLNVTVNYISDVYKNIRLHFVTFQNIYLL